MRYGLAALLLGAVLALSACGGGGAGETHSSTSEARGAFRPSPGQKASGSASPEKNAPQSAEARIEGFGSEAEGSERAELLQTFHEYLGSLAAEDDARTCSLLAAGVRESMQSLAAKAEKQLSCPEFLEALLAPQASALAKNQARGEIKRVREQGDTAFVVFHAPGARLWQLNLAKEGGRWKATVLMPAILAPSLSQKTDTKERQP